MNVINLKENIPFLEEYIKLCNKEWGTKKTKEDLDSYVKNKLNQIYNTNKVICVLGLINNDELIGFISLFKNDGDYRLDLTPWYATMYIKEEYRKRGYSKILNDALIRESIKLGYDKIYLKTDLINYYEKFGAEYIEDLENGEKLYSINCIEKKNK